MPQIKIVSDSTCDLSAALIERYDIDIVPLYVNLGGKTVRDGVGLSPEDIYSYVRKTGTLPGTVACSVQDFRGCFKKWTDLGFEVVCHTISSEMSCTFQNAVIAAQEFEGVRVVDSRNLSTGVGHVVIHSALLAQQGKTVDEIVKEQQAYVSKVRSSFILETLDYMKKGGRCSSVAVLGANLLKIKPSILVEEGVMRVGRKYRGTLEKVLDAYVDDQLEGRGDIRTDRIFITHTGCSREIVERVRARIARHLAFDEVLETTAGCTVTSHSGPNTLGILFVVK